MTGNQEKAQQNCETRARTYPREPAPHTFLAGSIYPASGKYEQAVAQANKAVELDPDSAVGYVKPVSNYAALNQLGESDRICAAPPIANWIIRFSPFSDTTWHS